MSSPPDSSTCGQIGPVQECVLQPRSKPQASRVQGIAAHRRSCAVRDTFERVDALVRITAHLSRRCVHDRVGRESTIRARVAGTDWARAASIVGAAAAPARAVACLSNERRESLSAGGHTSDPVSSASFVAPERPTKGIVLVGCMFVVSLPA